MHTSIKMDKPIELLNFIPVNPLISKCQIKVCYVSDEPNRNGSIITKETAKDLAKSIPGSPIVGFYNENSGDFEEHNRVIDISNGKFEIKDTTRPYGFVSMDANVWFQWFEDDGVQHEYLCTEGYIWTGQYPETQRIFEAGNNQSMELDEGTLNAHWTKDDNGKPKFFIINEAIMSKLCILGEDVEPCFEGAQITKVQFSFEEDFKEKLFNFMENMQKLLSEEKGGTPVFNTYAIEIGCSLMDAIFGLMWEKYSNENGPIYSLYGVYEEDDQKFAVLQNRADLTYYRLNFAYNEEDGFKPEEELQPIAIDFKPLDEPQFNQEEMNAYEVAYAAAHMQQEDNVEEIVEETSSENIEPAAEEVQEDNIEEEVVEYNLDEIPEYQELVDKYSQLEKTVETLNQQIENLQQLNNTLEESNKALKEFKLGIDREKKLDLINNTFYMLSDEQKQDCINNVDTYSYDDIEAKLSVICVRNKIGFNLDDSEDDENKNTVFNQNLLNDDEDNLGTPDWVKLVMETAKEKNIQ